MNIPALIHNFISPGLRPANNPVRTRKSRGQTLVELSLTLPILMILMSIVVEGGLALNAWIRVNTAARDATRFAMDSGRPTDTASLVLQKLQGIDFGSGTTLGSNNMEAFIVTATTNSSGQISSWSSNHVIDHGGSRTIQQSTIQARLNSQGLTESRSVKIIIVEVDYTYTPIMGTLLASGARIPMTSYAMVQSQQ